MDAELTDDLLILDGGLATELERRGYDVSGKLWSALLLQTAPQAIEQVHYDYYVAGARCAISASYQASYEGFASLGLRREESSALLRRSVELALCARARYRRDIRWLLTACTSPPRSDLMARSRTTERVPGRLWALGRSAHRFSRASVRGARDCGSRYLACETIPLLDEARALTTLLQRHPEVRAWVSFSSGNGTHTSHGEPLVDCARFLESCPGVIAIGVNCLRPDLVSEAIDALKAGTRKPIVVYPNSGEQWDAQTRTWHGSWDHDSLAGLASEWVKAGARFVGGCCRTGPQDIAALTATLTRAL